MKNSQKLEAVNKKIAELENKKKVLEDKMIENIAGQIAALLVKKRALRINIPAFLKKIEKIIDEINSI
jgi:hypothetical protein